MKKPSWFRILEAVRKVSDEGEINSKALSEAINMEPADASAWLCKLTRWGYLRRAGKSELGGKSIQYRLTDYGSKVRAPKEKRQFKGIPGGRPHLRIAANPGTDGR